MHHNWHRHHQFFCNKEMNEIYLSVFLSNIAESMISIFVPIYLYSLHFSIVKILFFFFIGHIGSVVFALPAAKLVAKIGAKHSILISTPFLILYYLGLRFLPHFPWLFFVLPLGVTFRSLFYNFGFDLNFIDHLNKKKVGRELSAMAVFSIIGTILSPLAAGLVIAFAGYATIFIVGCVILIIASLPLFITRDICPKINFTWKKIVGLFLERKNLGLILSYTGYAIESSIGRNIWPVFLIILLGAAPKVGLIASLSALVTVLIISLAGRLTDKIDPRKLLKLGTIFYFFGWVGCFFADASLRIFFIDSYKNVSERFLILPWSAMFYRIYDRESYFQSVVMRDIVFNASRVAILPFIMLIFMINFYPFAAAFAVAALFTLFYPLINKVKVNSLPSL